MGWWIALGILVLLAIIPIGVLVKYDEDGPLSKWSPDLSASRCFL